MAISGSATRPWPSPCDVVHRRRDDQQVLCRQSRQGARFYRQRAATSVHSRPAGSSLYEICTLSVDDVISSVRRLPDKSSAADPVPTFVLKQIIDLLAPFITEQFNRSLATCRFPGRFKDAFITPIVKKAGLDPTDASSYRPISDLPVLSKLLERLVVHQLMNYLTLNNLLPPLQSGFRPGHSTETAILLALSEIIQAVDRGDFAALVLLDLSAAFDTVDHEILLQRLRISYEIKRSSPPMVSVVPGRPNPTCLSIRLCLSCSCTVSRRLKIPLNFFLGPGVPSL